MVIFTLTSMTLGKGNFSKTTFQVSVLMTIGPPVTTFAFCSSECTIVTSTVIDLI